MNESLARPLFWCQMELMMSPGMLTSGQEGKREITVMCAAAAANPLIRYGRYFLVTCQRLPLSMMSMSCGLTAQENADL